MSCTTATACADTLVAGWISRFGVPDIITSDRGVQFTSDVWRVLTSRLGIRHVTTTAFHPQANGMIERSHRQLKDALRARLAGTDWPEHLPWILLGLRSSPKEDSGISSAELVYGIPLSLPGEFLSVGEPPPEAFAEHLRATTFLPTRPVPRTTGKTSLGVSTSHVYVKRGNKQNTLNTVFMGPYAVVEKRPKYWIIDLGGRHESTTVDRLKPHLGPSPLVPAAPPRRGRPLGQGRRTDSSALQPPASLLGGG